MDIYFKDLITGVSILIDIVIAKQHNTVIIYDKDGITLKI